MTKYRICDWHIRSAIPLPEAAAWRDGDSVVDIEIRTGRIACRLPAPAAKQVSGDGGVVFDVPDVARYSIQRGHAVIVDPAPGADPAAVRTYLYGTVLGILCHQRGLLPLHAGAVAIGERAIIVAGDSGAGKSSLTAALVSQGARLLSEDLCPVRLTDPIPRVLPSVPRFRLNRDVAEHLRLMPVANGGNPEPAKISIAWPPEALAAPARPVAIYGIDRLRIAPRPRLEAVGGLPALEMARSAVFRWEMAHAMGKSGAALRAAAALVSTVPCFRLWRTETLSGLQDMAALLLEHEAALC